MHLCVCFSQTFQIGSNKIFVRYAKQVTAKKLTSLWYVTQSMHYKSVADFTKCVSILIKLLFINHNLHLDTHQLQKVYTCIVYTYIVNLFYIIPMLFQIQRKIINNWCYCFVCMRGLFSIRSHFLSLNFCHAIILSCWLTWHCIHSPIHIACSNRMRLCEYLLWI